jgi:hypothetical protein
MTKMMHIIFQALSRDEWVPGQIGERTIIGIVTYLFEQLDDMDIPNQGPTSRIYLEVLKLASAIKNKMRAHNAYGSGEFPYDFKEFLNDDTFYLTRRDPIQEAGVRRTEHEEHRAGDDQKADHYLGLDGRRGHPR